MNTTKRTDCYNAESNVIWLVMSKQLFMKCIYPISDIHCHTRGHDRSIDYCRLVGDVVVAVVGADVVVQFGAVTPYSTLAVGLAADVLHCC